MAIKDEILEMLELQGKYTALQTKLAGMATAKAQLYTALDKAKAKLDMDSTAKTKLDNEILEAEVARNEASEAVGAAQLRLLSLANKLSALKEKDNFDPILKGDTTTISSAQEAIVKANEEQASVQKLMFDARDALASKQNELKEQGLELNFLAEKKPKVTVL
jgi:hypothetical protein